VEKRSQQVWAVDVAKGEPTPLGDMVRMRGRRLRGYPDFAERRWAVLAGEKQIWIRAISGKEQAKKALTFARNEKQLPQQKWSPDGRRSHLERTWRITVLWWCMSLETTNCTCFAQRDRDVSSALVAGRE